MLHHRSGLIHANASKLGSRDRILRAVLECFVERGYHGTTIREVAQRAGVSVPGLYHHFSSKHELLERLIDDTMDDLIAETAAALAAAAESPIDRFAAVLSAHVRYHCERSEESFVGNTELRSLEPDARRRIIAKRDRQQHLFDEVIQDAVRAGVFSVGDPLLASRALVTMCTAVASWYKPSGPLSTEQIVRAYLELGLSTLGSAAGAVERIVPLRDRYGRAVERAAGTR